MGWSLGDPQDSYHKKWKQKNIRFEIQCYKFWMLPKNSANNNLFDEFSRELVGSLILQGEKKSWKILLLVLPFLFWISNTGTYMTCLLPTIFHLMSKLESLAVQRSLHMIILPFAWSVLGVFANLKWNYMHFFMKSADYSWLFHLKWLPSPHFLVSLQEN